MNVPSYAGHSKECKEEGRRHCLSFFKCARCKQPTGACRLSMLTDERVCDKCLPDDGSEPLPRSNALRAVPKGYKCGLCRKEGHTSPTCPSLLQTSEAAHEA